MRIVLGLLLLTAAGLKLAGLNMPALPRVGWFATPQIQVATVAWEFVLGLWLLSNATPASSWLAAMGTFLTFAGVSGYFGWIGVASCGCFGVIKASPWAAFSLDLLAIALLTVTRPPFERTSLRFPSGIFPIVSGAGVVLVAIALAGWWTCGSPSAALARISGFPITVSPAHLDLGAGFPGDTTTGAVEIRNSSEQPVRLIGGTNDCTCVVTLDLPLTIPAGETRFVAVRMKIPATQTGMVTRTAEFWTDRGNRRVVRLRLGCRVVQRPG